MDEINRASNANPVVVEEGQNEPVGEAVDEQVPEAEDLPRPRNVRYEYVLAGTFDNQNDFQKQIEIENCWKVHKKLAQKEGLKTIYWCKNVKSRGKRCLAEFYTIKDRFPGDVEIFLYRRNQAHTCDTAANKVARLSDDMKKGIEKYIGMKMTKANDSTASQRFAQRSRT